jgi:hypothetical protein
LVVLLGIVATVLRSEVIELQHGFLSVLFFYLVEGVYVLDQGFDN